MAAAGGRGRGRRLVLNVEGGTPSASHSLTHEWRRHPGLLGLAKLMFFKPEFVTVVSESDQKRTRLRTRFTRIVGAVKLQHLAGLSDKS